MPRGPQDFAARARSEQKLHVERIESRRDRRSMIDDDHVVARCEGLREREADLSAANDDDPHDSP